MAFGAVLLTLLLVTRAGEALLAELFDVTPRDAEPFARRLLDPVVRAMPFVVAWAYHRRHMLGEAARFTEGYRQATVRRVYVYAIAPIGLAWLIFGVLLFGHWRFGWRGRRATSWTVGGFALLGLAYFGSKFVLESILGRHWG